MAANDKKKTRVDRVILQDFKTKKALDGTKMGRKKKRKKEEKTKPEVEVFRAVLRVTFLPY
ncbi:MAG: hypothetical protein LBE64_21190 [Acinetobacter pittii]|jgi:hypothetical protein|nr:hypothetical protein [Acinetobacter pittii]